MQTSPARPVVSRSVLVILLLVVSAAFAYYYFDSQAALMNSDQNGIRWKAAYDSQKLTALTLQLEILSLNQNITNLDQQIASLQTNNTLQILSLRNQVAQLQNKSALATLQLSIIEHVSKLTFTQLVVNQTVMLSPNSTTVAASGGVGHNGTFVFISPTGCAATGTQNVSSTPIVENILLNSKSPPLTSFYASYSSQPFTVYFKNIGPVAERCTYSALFVYNANG